ncbi:FGGY carbohydrate kinase domain-containing protein-like [Trichogramma pretiosum]|uniref:FGGY carbohydrate kinase domain-containing protein-like n=1 Tax=Trichogramma pretiosum TaxID=7493 RepID=UPI000C718DBD|nr:FGGY carbohydrate kinase domain-containing protein-like [Trichogramma pretiosum]
MEITTQYLSQRHVLTWKATGCESRPSCSLVCKCNYRSGPNITNNWCFDYLEEIELSDLATDNYRKIGTFKSE